MKKSILLLGVSLFLICLGTPQTILAANIGGVDIHGFMSQGYLSSGEYNYLAHNSKDGSFEYNEMGINFSKSLTEMMRVGLQLFSRDLGDVANNKITLDWAYGDYAFKNWLGLRFGKIKSPNGLYNESRDMDMLRTCIVLPQGIYNDLLRDNSIAIIGASAYGDFNLGAIGNLSYQLLEGVPYSDRESGTGKFSESRLYERNLTSAEVKEDMTYKGSTGVSLFWDTPLPGLRFGFTRMDIVSESSIFLGSAVAGTSLQDVTLYQTGRSIIQVASTEYTWNDLIVAAEYMHRESEIETWTNFPPGGGITKVHSVAESYYLSASYRFSDLFSLGAYYSEYYPDANDKDGDDFAIDHRAWEKDLALTLRFDLNPYWVLKLEGHAVNGTANVMYMDNTDNDFDEEDWYYGAAKLTVSF